MHINYITFAYYSVTCTFTQLGNMSSQVLNMNMLFLYTCTYFTTKKIVSLLIYNNRCSIGTSCKKIKGTKSQAQFIIESPMGHEVKPQGLTFIFKLILKMCINQGNNLLKIKILACPTDTAFHNLYIVAFQATLP